MENDEKKQKVSGHFDRGVGIPRQPEVGEFVRGVGTLVAIEKVPPPPPPKPETDYIFEEISARTEIRLNGKLLTEGVHLSDFYGKGKSVEEAIRTARDYADENEITADSDIEVVAIKEIDQARKRPTNKKAFYAEEFLGYDYMSSHNLPGKSESVVWSSKTG